MGGGREGGGGQGASCKVGKRAEKVFCFYFICLIITLRRKWKRLERMEEAGGGRGEEQPTDTCGLWEILACRRK